MKKIAVLSLLVVGICLMATQAWSQAHFYMTLDQGNFKAYNVNGSDQTRLEVEPVSVVDGWTHVRHRLRGEMGGQWTMRWALDDEGNVWFFGMVEQDQQPAEPILWVDAPLYAGKTWSQSVEYPGYGTYHYSQVCEAEEKVTVPYGTFTTYRVRQLITSNTGVTERVHWFCDCTGRVKYQLLTEGPALFELTGVGTVVPVENSTWGSVKSLYR